MAKWDGSLVEVVVKPSTNYKVTKEVKKLEILDGYTIEDFLNEFKKLVNINVQLNNNIMLLEDELKSLKDAYKLNAVVTAAKIEDIKEN